jgi:hypothetical protein
LGDVVGANLVFALRGRATVASVDSSEGTAG